MSRLHHGPSMPCGGYDWRGRMESQWAVLSACLPAVSGLPRRRRPGLIDHPARSITHPSAPLACQRCL
ncbi:hypothetical protein AAFF_G00310840 [Aldrovandia affinis]|uniref:Uncharacterized protein n=1 Tax=Aldrovandia affinis TaxID=143900 RepID=A0AAD7W010_9TELE|nr:hypothetical protein AAFF_G00310840 [Aldrovandia affinis]